MFGCNKFNGLNYKINIGKTMCDYQISDSGVNLKVSNPSKAVHLIGIVLIPTLLIYCEVLLNPKSHIRSSIIVS